MFFLFEPSFYGSETSPGGASELLQKFSPDVAWKKHAPPVSASLMAFVMNVDSCVQNTSLSLSLSTVYKYVYIYPKIYVCICK